MVFKDYLIFYRWLHFLSVSKRKSRINSFSIFNLLFSYLYSCSVFAGLLPRCFGNVFLLFFLLFSRVIMFYCFVWFSVFFRQLFYCFSLRVFFYYLIYRHLRCVFCSFFSWHNKTSYGISILP